MTHVARDRALPPEPIDLGASCMCRAPATRYFRSADMYCCDEHEPGDWWQLEKRKESARA